MLRAIWFFIQITIIVISAVWLYERPGSIVFELMDYKITMTAGLFLITLAVLILVSLFLYRILSAILSVPKKIDVYRKGQLQRQGYRALTRGLVAVAAGDVGRADRFAKETRKLLPQEAGLPLLLEAQAAKLRGEEGAARRSFQELLKDKDASFFGLRGLLISAMDSGDKAAALDYAYQALALHPKQAWLIKIVYELEIKNKYWEKAQKTLQKAVKYGAFSKDQARKDQVAIFLQMAQILKDQDKEKEAFKNIHKAYTLDPFFVPSVLLLGGYYQEQNKRRKIIKMVEKIWKINPHPDLARLWDSVSPKNTQRDPMKRMRWFEKLLALKPDSVYGQIAAAKTAMDDSLWGEARAYLTIAEKIQPSSVLYKLWATVEENLSNDAEKVREWLEKAAEAPAEKQWVCYQTGRVYSQWLPLASPHNSFNTIIWDFPGARAASVDIANYNDPMFIESVA